MTEPGNDEISLLDLMVVVAENWLLLLLAPLAIGGVAYWVLANQSPSYSSDAIVALPAAEIVDFVEEGVADGSLPPEFAISGRDGDGLGVVSISTNGSGTRSTAQSLSAEQSQLTLVRAGRGGVTLDQLVQALQIAVQEGQLLSPALELTARIDSLEDTLAMRDAAIGRLEETLAAPATVTDPEVYAWSAIALDQMLTGRSADQSELLGLRQALATSGEDVVVVAPSAPSAQGRSSLLMAILAGLGSGFALLILVFVRAGVRHAVSEDAGKKKLARIRNAVLLRKSR